MPFGGFCPFPLRLGGDAETGWSAAEHARACADLAAVKRTLPLAKLTFSQTGAAATIIHFTAQWGSEVANRPTFTYGGFTGLSTWTFALNAVDAYDISEPITFRHGLGCAAHDGVIAFANVEIYQLHQIKVYLTRINGVTCDGAATVYLW